MTMVELPDEAATEALARRGALHLPTDDLPLVIYLQGDLGAGKTSFARGMLRGLGEAGPVRSPTYGLLGEYQVAGGVVIHMDLYRMQDPREVLALGLADHLPGSRLWLIEWPERASGGLPAPDVVVTLEVSGNGRRAQLESRSGRGRQWQESLCRQ